MKPFVFHSSLAVVVALSFAIEARPVQAAEKEAMVLFTKDLTRHHKYQVLQVINGDALTIRWNGRAILMGLLGVEAKRPEATKFLKEQLEGQTVCLEYDPEIQHNQRGWPIAYFYRCSDGVLINQAVLARGFGLPAGHAGPHAELLVAAAELAQLNEEGLWTGGVIRRTSVEPSKEAREGLEVTIRRRQERRARFVLWQQSQERKAMECLRANIELQKANIELQKWLTVQEVLRRGGSVQMQWTQPAPRGVVPNF